MHIHVYAHDATGSRHTKVVTHHFSLCKPSPYYFSSLVLIVDWLNTAAIINLVTKSDLAAIQGWLLECSVYNIKQLLSAAAIQHIK